MTKRTLVAKITRQYRNRVKECRLRSMIPKQEDLARMTGISRSTISALENNRLFFSSHYALLIAEALRCRLDDLYDKQKSGSGLSSTDGHQGL
jgi:DNA-binding XRE family transcriptional regulator